jgi:hypothetical protein
MPETRSAERGLMGADENMRSSLARTAWNWWWDGSDVNDSVRYGWSRFANGKQKLVRKVRT